jgi:hypothetical protein
MPLYRVHAYDHEHYATLLVRADRPERAGEAACWLVGTMDLGCYPADAEQQRPEIVRIEQASSWFDAHEAFDPVVESIDEVEEGALDER